MSRNTSLMLRIGEAKDLPAKDISGFSDPYCVIKVDNEQVARTATVWRSLSPFWGEEYTLHLPNGFVNLDVYVYDQDKVSGDDLIGKVTLTRESIQKGSTKGLDQWFKICHVNKKMETEGEIHMDIKYVLDPLKPDQGKIRVNVIEARDLEAKDISGSSDPYVKLSLLGQQKQTSIIRGSLYPSWQESFEFSVPRLRPEEAKLSLNVWDWDRMASDDFMGKVEISLSDLEPNQEYDQWFFLQPKDEKVKEHTDKSESNGREHDNGFIRIRARLSEERVLPSEYYQPLISLLMESVSPEKQELHGPTPLRLLQEVMTLDMMEIANTLVKLYLGQNKIRPYLDVICTEEIENTGNPNTLFRGNSLATKSVDQVMKIVGMPYLHETLGPVIDKIYDDRKLVELDPSRLELLRSTRRPSLKSLLKDEHLIEQSLETLIGYLSLIRDRILASVSRVPPVMRLIFKQVRQRIEEKWPGPEYEDHKYVGISGFLFLRFFAPATLSPKLFHMKDHHPDARISRTLTLLAKSVQNMGNLGLQMGKEHWMEPLSPFIKQSVDGIKRFIDELVNIEDDAVIQQYTRRRSVFHPSVTIKQGYLWKRRWDHIKFISSFTFKKRYFWLKYDTLAYAKKPNDQVRNNIPISHINAVERVDRHAFAKSNVGQVITKNSQGHTELLYFQAKDINDMYSWISSIRKTIILNDKLLEMYHPAVFNKDRWTCCFRVGKEAPGCSRTHSRVTIGDWRDPLDPDAEAQTIYSQLYLGRDLLRQKYTDSQEALQERVRENVEALKRQKRQQQQQHQQQQQKLRSPNHATQQQGTQQHQHIEKDQSTRQLECPMLPQAHRCQERQNHQHQQSKQQSQQLQSRKHSHNQSQGKSLPLSQQIPKHSQKQQSQQCITNQNQQQSLQQKQQVSKTKQSQHQQHCQTIQQQQYPLENGRAPSTGSTATPPCDKQDTSSSPATNISAATLRQINSTNGRSSLTITLPVDMSTTAAITPPASPMHLAVNQGRPELLPRSTSFQDTQVASVTQLLDVIQDLERAHAIYERREREKARGSISGGKFV